MCLLPAGLVLVALVSCAAALEILAPRDEYVAPGGEAWLVVRTEVAPSVTLDGGVVPLVAEDDGVFHYRLAGLGPEGSRLRVISGEDVLTRVLRGEDVSGAGFHGVAPESCWLCHDSGDGGCVGCHSRDEDGKHRPVLAEGCVRCHTAGDRRAGDVATLCTGCHPQYASGRHGGIRHAVASERDPLRPGRRMDCASCHDPHAPRCLSCLGRAELRAWCKTCHGGS